ncbi:unnamed protein product [Calypogeia fissa]
MDDPNTNLIVISCSHYCEKARWALDRAGVLYKESKHVVLFHMFFTRGLGAGTSCPKFVMGRSKEQVVLQESPDILHFAEKNIRREENRLYPADAETRKLVEAWEVRFDKRFGPHVRRWAYCYLLFDKCSFRLLTQGAPPLERVVAWILMPFLRRIVYNALYCNKPAAKENSLHIIQETFQEVGDILADGRPFMCGSRFTAADLTFASLAGPVIFPPGYGATHPPLDTIPTEMKEAVQQLRKTPAGQHVLKMYDTERGKIVT